MSEQPVKARKEEEGGADRKGGKAVWIRTRFGRAARRSLFVRFKLGNIGAQRPLASLTVREDMAGEYESSMGGAVRNTDGNWRSIGTLKNRR